MHSSTQLIFIGDHLVDPDSHTIIGPDEAHHVSAQMIGVIKVLTDAAGSPVERQVLIDQVWSGDAHADRALTRCISRLRHYLGDCCDRPSYIETVPGCGYRLIARVHEPIPLTAENPARTPRSTKAVTDQTHAPRGGERVTGLWPFLLELRERKVCKAALHYSVAIWLIFQIADVVFDALQFPEWALAYVVVLGVLGFPIALMLAWTFEVTPTGLVLDIPCRDEAAARQNGRDWGWNILLLAASILISAQLLATAFEDGESEQAGTAKLAAAESVIIMPFRANSVSLETKAFAFALSEQLRHLLRSEYGLNVIAVDALADLPMAQGSADLLLQGSVNMSRDLTQVIVHLVDASDGHDLWSDVFMISGKATHNAGSELARQILSTLPLESEDVDGNTAAEDLAACGSGLPGAVCSFSRDDKI